MTVVYWICFIVLSAAILLTLIRVESGPSILDRSVAVDVITAALVGFVAVLSVYQELTQLTALMAALALVGFLSTVIISRFAAAESDDEKRILTPEEAARSLWEEAQRQDEEEEFFFEYRDADDIQQAAGEAGPDTTLEAR